MNYKTLNELINHLNNNGINISKSDSNKLLILGYYHCYKGYRFYKKSNKQLPFTSFDQILKLVEYDSNIKSLLYGHVMFIEMAIKNIVLETVMEESDSDDILDMFTNVINCFSDNKDYNTAEIKYHNKAITLYSSLIDSIEKAKAKHNPIICHYYKDSPLDIKLYALFEIITLGDLAKIVESLNYNTRKKVSKVIGYRDINDTNYEVIYVYLNLIKVLRNALAHNGIIYDARFNNYYPSNPAKATLKSSTGLNYVNFNTIGDFIFLICYIEKLLGIPKDKLICLLDKYNEYNAELLTKTNQQLYDRLIQSDINYRIIIMKTFINS